MREPGGADLYPDLEIKWQRGEDPHLEVRRCKAPRDKRRPAGEEGAAGVEESELLETVSLSPFDNVHLHYLLQCHGLALARQGKETPVAESREEACKLLPDTSWGRTTMFVVGTLVLLPALLAVRCLRTAPARLIGGPRGGKVKQEDASSEDASENFDLEDAI